MGWIWGILKKINSSHEHRKNHVVYLDKFCLSSNEAESIFEFCDFLFGKNIFLVEFNNSRTGICKSVEMSSFVSELLTSRSSQLNKNINSKFI